jgi:hypothetical protein
MMNKKDARETARDLSKQIATKWSFSCHNGEPPVFNCVVAKREEEDGIPFNYMLSCYIYGHHHEYQKLEFRTTLTWETTNDNGAHVKFVSNIRHDDPEESLERTIDAMKEASDSKFAGCHELFATGELYEPVDNRSII